MGGIRASFREWNPVTAGGLSTDDCFLIEKADPVPGTEIGRYLTFGELLGFIQSRDLAFLGLNSFSQGITLSVEGADAEFVADVDASQLAGLMLKTAGLNRWAIRKTNGATDPLQIKCYDDAGVLLRNALNIDRADGLWTIIGDVKLSGAYRFYGTALHNPASLPTGTVNQPAGMSGTWTPTGTSTTNIASATPRLARWVRTGNVVSFAGEFDAAATAAGAAELRLSLPLPSTFSTNYQASGILAAGSSVLAGRICALSASPFNLLRLLWLAPDSSARAFNYSGSYEVL
jgi:hypothetical protein